jgi:hypothetical protein
LGLAPSDIGGWDPQAQRDVTIRNDESFLRKDDEDERENQEVSNNSIIHPAATL